jgi:endonuclease V-like protein UPF0215 family
LIQLVGSLDGQTLPLPSGVQLAEKGKDWFRYKVKSPVEINPIILQNLVTGGFNIVKVEEVQRSLETVYLQAVNQAPTEDIDYGE